MADNITQYPGTGGATVRSTDIGGGVHVQHVKQVDGSDNAVAGVPAAAAPAAALQVAGTDGIDLRAILTGTEGALIVQGYGSHGAVLGGRPLLVAGEARSTAPTPVDDGDAVRPILDLDGRLSVERAGPRALQGDQATTVTATGDDIVAAGATGVKRDLLHLHVENTDTSDATVSLTDGAGGTVRLVFVVPGTTAAGNGRETFREFRFDPPLKQASAASVWEVGVTTGGTIALKVFAQYRETKQ